MEKNNIQAAIDAGTKLAAVQSIPRCTDEEATPVIVEEGFRVEIVSNDLKRPIRKTGKRCFVSAKSFCSYVNKHAVSDETIIIADEDKGAVTAVLNDHGSKPAWGDFVALLNLGFSEQWETWLRRNKDGFSQAEFVDFIEDNRADLKTGKFADAEGKEVENLGALQLTALLSNLQMTTQEKFSSKIDPTSGRMTLNYESEEAGNGNIEIPKHLFLAIPIYKNGDLFQVTIRLRHRMQGGSARFYYIIDQIPQLKQAAFGKICRRIEKGNIGSEPDENLQFSGTNIEVLRGTF
jgi:uncharacterized protein YfdQ (DUF2303 family)